MSEDGTSDGGQHAVPQGLFTREGLEHGAPPHYAAVFHGKINRKEAEARLQHENVGTYLIRESDSCPGEYSLSLRLSKSTKHWKIYYVDGKYNVGGASFSSLDGLVMNGLTTLEAPTVIKAPKPSHQVPSLELLKHREKGAPPGGGSSRMSVQEDGYNDGEPLYELATYLPEVIPDVPNRISRLSLGGPNDAPLPSRRVASKHEVKQHNFTMLSGIRPTTCDVCRSVMLSKAAVKCVDCGTVCHADNCKDDKNECEPNKKLVKRVFGADLIAYCKAYNVSVPYIITRCIDEVERRGLHEEGIYRVSGSKAEVDALKKGFDRDPEHFDIAPDLDINSVATVMKLYLRELPAPLIPFESYRPIVNSLMLSDATQRARVLRTELFNIPDVHFRTLKRLMLHLKTVETNKSSNKMTTNNLGTVFGPSILRDAYAETDAKRLAEESQQLIKVVELLMNNHALIFSD